MKTDNTKETIKLTTDTKNKMLVHEMLTDSGFMSRIAKAYSPTWFTSSETHGLLISELVDWYKTTGMIPTTNTLVSTITKKNENKPIPQTTINEMVRMYNDSKSYDVSSFTHEDLMEYVSEYLKTIALKSNMLEMACAMEKDVSKTIVDKALKNMDDLSKAFLEDDDKDSEGCVSFGEDDDDFNDFMDWVSNPSARISTGFDNLDKELNGGFMKNGKSLSVFMAQTGLGKSNILANIAINVMKQGLSPALISLEMDKKMYCKRLYSIMTDVPIDELAIHTQLVRERRYAFLESHKESKLMFKEFPVKGVSSKDIQKYIEGMEKKPDVLLVDYLNLLNANVTGRNTQMFEEGLRISEDLRAVSQELEIPIITAVQTNTDGMNSDDISLKNISQSRGIAHTADFIGILYKSKEERDNEKENGKGMIEKFSLKVEKSRFGGAGNTIEIAYNNRTLSMCDYEKVQHLVSTISTNKPEEKADCDSFLSDMFGVLSDKAKSDLDGLCQRNQSVRQELQQVSELKSSTQVISSDDVLKEIGI